MKRLILLCAAMVLLSGCSQVPEPSSATIFAMDTVMEMTVYGDPRLLDVAEDLLLDMERRLSTTDENSEIAALNRTGNGSVSADTEALLGQAFSLCQLTDGALDISIYPVVRAWGFTTGEYHVQEPQELSELLETVDYSQIVMDNGSVCLAPGMQIDLGSVAKGWAGDSLLELFRKNGVESALLNLGGNVQALGAKPDGSPWRVGVKDPVGDSYAGVLEIVDKAVITSGGYQRYFEQDGKTWHHIIDPATGLPADSGLLSVTVVGDKGVMCDGLSTALFVMGLDRAGAYWKENGGFEVIFITNEGITVTDGIAGDFEPLGNCKGTDVEVLCRDEN